MPRRPAHPTLRVRLNNRLVGTLNKAPDGAVSFRYARSWLEWDYAIPISLSLPLSPEAYRGAPVAAVFDNLLPDSEALRRRIAERIGAEGYDTYSLLGAIGHDCVGALQFVPEEADEIEEHEAGTIEGEPVDDAAIEQMLQGLAQSPLGLDRDDPFRISVAGAQEKTALLWHEGRWLKPHGTTPTTHILKPQIGTLPTGMDLSNSVENEYYCLRLAAAFGLPVNRAEIQTFGTTKALVVERFDRRWTRDGRLLRLPQEDCCQALSVPPSRKYQSDGGPGLVSVLDLLRGSDDPAKDQTTVFKAQILFWLIGAPDGHAKNFSIFLTTGGSYHLTPLYDVLTAQPSLEARQIERKKVRLAMSVGTNRHYRMSEIQGRHFVQTGREAGLPQRVVRDAIAEMAGTAELALERIETELPADFPAVLHTAVKAAVMKRAGQLARAIPT